MPRGRLWEHENTDPLPLRRGTGPACSESRGRGNHRPRQRWATAFACSASQRAGFGSPGAMRTLRASLVLLIAACGAVAAEETNGPALSAVDTNSAVFNAPETNVVALREVRPVSTLDLRSFRLVWERNIFDPNRSPGSFTEGPRRDSGSPARTESFALVGTMSYEKGCFAFFESASSQYQKVLETSNRIAGYTIAESTPTHVKLESTNGLPIELRVGMQMKRREKSERTASQPGEASRRGPSSPSSGGPRGEATPELKRVIQNRQPAGEAGDAKPPSAPTGCTQGNA